MILKKSIMTLVLSIVSFGSLVSENTGLEGRVNELVNQSVEMTCVT